MKRLVTIWTCPAACESLVLRGTIEQTRADAKANFKLHAGASTNDLKKLQGRRHYMSERQLKKLPEFA